jgi:CMP-2-keto-3-deoxyoctulosonic acid synthetase
VQRILDAAEAFGARVIFTDPACFTGTDRVAQAVSILQREQVI